VVREKVAFICWPRIQKSWPWRWIGCESLLILDEYQQVKRIMHDLPNAALVLDSVDSPLIHGIRFLIYFSS
jgi:hypothetical protein